MPPKTRLLRHNMEEEEEDVGSSSREQAIKMPDEIDRLDRILNKDGIARL